jgi:hypothetical protein
VSYRFHPAAEAEHLDQVAYYESQQPGLGARYFHAIDALLKRASQAPVHFAHVSSSRLRRAVLRQFKFTVIFREFSEGIEVLAVAHQRRRPGYWRGRL